MPDFLQQHAKLVSGMLSGWDRLRFRGTLPLLCHSGGLSAFFHATGRLFKEFKEFALAASAQLKQEAMKVAQRLDRPCFYVNSSQMSKEQMARDEAKDEQITEGLVCCISAVEPCSSFAIRKNKSGQFDFVRTPRRCQHMYHYYMHPLFGLMHVRLQTWLPFDQFICINGREWLGRSLERAGVRKYLRAENCFLQVDDVLQAQRMLDEQVQFDWQPALNEIARWIAPTLNQILTPVPMSYYWTITESEWATDFMFNSVADLSRLYPSLLHHAMEGLGSRDLLRFLGQKVPLHGNCFPGRKCQILTDLQQRVEGIRIKHRVGSNSIKMYNKQGSVLRVETTLNKIQQLKSPRRKEDGSVKWMQMRKGVVDARQRAEFSNDANGRYIDAISVISEPITLASVTASLCEPVKWKKQRIRGLNPLHQPDAQLLEAISKGEFLLHGLRNRDLQAVFFPDATDHAKEKRRRSAQISRKLRMLRAHGLLSKVPHTHRYQVSDKGRRVITALIAVRTTDITKLPKAA
jgi:hypothetical protein